MTKGSFHFLTWILMNAKISDLMMHPVMTATPHQTIGHLKEVMRENSSSCMPVVDTENRPVGIITASDMLDDHPDNSPVSAHMNKQVYTVPQYNDASMAARIMRNHRFHHVVVTHEQEVVGIISSYDLLKLVENHRFVMKNPPTESSKGGKRLQ
jgi:CBS domain-containing protein